MRKHFLFFCAVVLLPALVALSVSGTGCSKKSKETARLIPESVGAYVYAFTSGIISKASPITVKFAAAAVEATQAGQEAAQGLISFRPAIKGKAVWEDERTLVFQPDGLLPSKTAYTATLSLKKIFSGLPSDAESFSFEFHTRDQFFTVEADGISAPDPSNLSVQEITGVVATADLATEEEMEGLVTAKQKGKTLPVKWTQSGDQLTHYFTVSNVSRNDKASEVDLAWNGKSLGVGIKDGKKVPVPAIGDFKVVNARVVQGQEQYLLLHFSDPLLGSQNLDGLVRLQNYSGNLRYIISGNQVRVYPSSRITGRYTVQISSSVRNAAQQTMANAGLWAVTFENPQPAVRLVGNGVVVPVSEGLLFPFEAVGLRAVEVEIFKIYHNNILQFLQTSDLDGDERYDLYRVGRVIVRKKIQLDDAGAGARTHEWTRYNFDLGPLIGKDPKSIYQVRIGFRQEYAAFQCEGAGEEDGNALVAAEEPALNEDGEIESMMENWYGFRGYYEGYRWEDRNDPCKPAYYHSERFVQRNVLASNLGIIAKTGKDNSCHVTVSDLRSAAPVSGAKVEFYDYQQQLLASAQTDAKGNAGAQLPRKAFVVVVSHQGQNGYLRLDGGNSLSLSRFDVAGAEPQKGLKGFLYGERGVWRPGDSIFLHFILEDRTARLPADYPITLEVYDPRGQLFHKRTTSANVGGLYPLHLKTGADAPTGNWTAKVKVGGATFDRIIKVETVKPNRLKINLDAGKESLAAEDTPVQVKLSSTWLHGAPAKNLKAVVELQLRAQKTTFPKYSAYIFEDPSYQFESEPSTVFDGNLDAEGQASFVAGMAGSLNAPGKLTANFKTRVFEKGGDFSTDNVSLSYSPFTHYAGVRLPVNKYQEKRFELKKAGKVALVSVDAAGNPQAGRKLNTAVYKISDDWWWEIGDDNVSRYNAARNLRPEMQTELTTGSRGEAEWALTFERWGRYLIRVCDQESGHCTGDYFWAGYSWDDESDTQGRRDAAAMLAVSSDKTRYNVGDKVQLTIPSTEIGKAFVSIENGSRVVQTFWVDASKGDNKFSFSATTEMAPTVYAHVSLIQPHAQTKNDLPIRLYGVIPISVEDPGTRLSPKIKMPDELKPESAVTVEVSEEKGRPMAYTIAVVDDGLLDLTRFKTPSPWESFYAREALGVTTWDIYDMVLGAHGGQLGRILSIGGDAALVPGAQPQAMRFKPVVVHLGPFYLKKGGKAQHTINIPNYVGSVRTMVVAADKGAYGSTEKTTPVKKPLMVLATVPRVLSPGETLKIPVNVFAMDKKVRDVSVSLSEKSGLVQIIGPSRQSLSFSKPGDAIVEFEVKVKEAVGVAKFSISAEGAGEKAGEDIEVQVRNPNPYASRVYAKVLEAGQEWKESFEAVGMRGTNTGVLELSSIPPINLGERLEYLLQYPYGCLEQTLSGGFPQLYVSRLIELNDSQKKNVPENIKATVERLRKFQTTNGGFAYWPGQGTPDQWSTSYAGHFLLEAKAMGYAVPDNLLDNWLKFQKKAARIWDPKQSEYGFGNESSNELGQAYRLYTMALAKSPDLSAMNRLRESPKLASQARWSLAAAYAAAGKQEIAKEIIKNLSRNIEPYTELSYTYGSDLRDRAIILETLLLTGDKTNATELVKYISDKLAGGGWYGTQTIAWALMSVGKYVGQTGAGKDLQFSYQTGGKPMVNAGANTPMMQIKVPVDGAQKEVAVKNTGKGVLFARLILRGQPVVGDTKAATSDLGIAVSFKRMDGTPIDVKAIPQGTDFYAEVKVTHPGKRPLPYRELALAQIFPSGWEIINSRLDGIEGTVSPSAADYVDIRDDRVNTFFGLRERETKTYRIQLNAAYLGRFYMPGALCEAMYDSSISARNSGQWVSVVGPDNI